jgi:hypothetical protein
LAGKRWVLASSGHLASFEVFIDKHSAQEYTVELITGYPLYVSAGWDGLLWQVAYLPIEHTKMQSTTLGLKPLKNGPVLIHTPTAFVISSSVLYLPCLCRWPTVRVTIGII